VTTDCKFCNGLGCSICGVDSPPGISDREEIVSDLIVEYLIKTGQALTLDNYLNIAYMGDKEAMANLGPEDAAEIEDLLEEAQIADVPSNEVH
jgi:hypothetical protein